MASTVRVRLTAAVLACLAIGMLVPAGGRVAADDDDDDRDDHPIPAPIFFDRQWNLQTIGIEEAWDEGEFGDSDVRVAILDTGIDYGHPDLVGRVDLDDSISLVSLQPTCLPGEPGAPSLQGPNGEDARAASEGRELFHDYHSHGTAVAGLVASNGIYLAGVTRDTTLLAIKVHDRTRRNCLSVYLEGIYAAVRRDADVIHMSFPLEFTKADFPGALERIDKAMRHAHRKGAVLVAAAGNAAAHLDPEGPQFRFCTARYVICVSATGPTKANPHPDRVADYTNFGLAAIDFAGPGGSGVSVPPAVTPDTPVTLHCSRFVIAPQGRPCGADGPIWTSVGTSFGAAATSGLAALLVDVIGSERPDSIERAIRKSAVDVRNVPNSTLDVRGPDPYYGRGRIDVEAALERDDDD
jgi:lantibiotic leader peptide-processing serine protease